LTRSGVFREVLVAQRKGKATGTKVKSIEQYCSVCKKTFNMPIVEEADNHEVIWLKCPECEGFLPYMTGQAEEGEDAFRDGEGDGGEHAHELALEDIDIEKALEYSEKNEYKIGDIIYHRSWNDYGKVIEKEILPGHRKTIHVQFVNQGKIRLLEGVA
jgi:hypothetical protein